MSSLQVQMELRTKWGKKLPQPRVEAMAPVASVVGALATAVRARVQGKGEAADGQAFGFYVDRNVIEPVKKPGRRRKGFDGTPIPRPIIGYRSKPEKVWIHPSDGYPVPRTYYRKTAKGAYQVEMSTYIKQINGDTRFRFSITGGSWRNLMVSITNAGRVRVGFGGKGPSLKQPGAYVRNAIKMRTAQDRVAKQIMEPSRAEVMAVLHALMQRSDAELARIVEGQPSPRRLPKSTHPVYRTIVAGRQPLR
jgi:hypothetical protein